MKSLNFEFMSRVLVRFVVLAMIVGLVLWAMCSFDRPVDVDENAYRAIAEGGIQEVCRPYSNRVLHPLILMGLSQMGLRLETAAVTLNVVSEVVLLTCVLTLLCRLMPETEENGKTGRCGDRREFLIWGLMATLVWWPWVTGLFMHDLFATALTALFFVVIVPSFRRLVEEKDAFGWGRISLVFLLLFLIQMTRESTWILTLVFVGVAVCRRCWGMASAGLLALIAGMMVVALISRGAPQNVSSLPTPIYLVAKAFANGCANLFGVIPWNDAYARSLPHFYPNDPVWKMSLPFKIGGVSSVGIYEFTPRIILSTVWYWLFSFPVAGLILVRMLWIRHDLLWRLGLRTIPMGILVAAIAGLLYWLSVPFAGRSCHRLVGYAWPLFWIAVPYLYSLSSHLDDSEFYDGGIKRHSKTNL